MTEPDDTGFDNPEGARMALRRLRLRNRLRDVQDLIPAILHRLDHGRDVLGDVKTFSASSGIALAEGDLKGGISRKTIDRVECQDVREDDLLQGVDLVLQFLNALLDDLGHGRFSNISNTPNVNPAGPVSASSK